jgi:hypothetical protein
MSNTIIIIQCEKTSTRQRCVPDKYIPTMCSHDEPDCESDVETDEWESSESEVEEEANEEDAEFIDDDDDDDDDSDDDDYKCDSCR